jgi:hypothetical protein
MYDLYTKETRFNLQENSTNFEKKYVFLAEQLNRKIVEALVKGFSDIRLGYSRYDYAGASLRRRLRRCVDFPSGTWAPIWWGFPTSVCRDACQTRPATVIRLLPKVGRVDWVELHSITFTKMHSGSVEILFADRHTDRQTWRSWQSHFLQIFC